MQRSLPAPEAGALDASGVDANPRERLGQLLAEAQGETENNKPIENEIASLSSSLARLCKELDDGLDQEQQKKREMEESRHRARATQMALREVSRKMTDMEKAYKDEMCAKDQQVHNLQEQLQLADEQIASAKQFESQMMEAISVLKINRCWL